MHRNTRYASASGALPANMSTKQLSDILIATASCTSIYSDTAAFLLISGLKLQWWLLPESTSALVAAQHEFLV